MQQSAKNRRRPDQTGQVVARLAAFLALAFHLANLKAAADEVGEVYPAHDQLPSSVARRQIQPVIGSQSLDRLGFDQRDVAGFRVIELTIAFESASGVGDRYRDLMRGATMRVRKKYPFDCSSLLAHLFRAS